MVSDVIPLFYREGNNKSFPVQALTCLDGEVLMAKLTICLQRAQLELLANAGLSIQVDDL